MNYSIVETEEFRGWFNHQTKKEQGQINARIAKISTTGHFGDVKKLMKVSLSYAGRMVEEFTSLPFWRQTEI